MSGDLVFEHIEIRRMPGFRREGFTLKGLTPGINVVYGPNGSGKTTTARAIEALLWPEAAASLTQADLFCRFRLAGSEWTVEVDGGRHRWHRNGAPADAPALADPSVRDRYRLSLTELLQVKDEAFARFILKESAGGYDVEAARQAAFGKGRGVAGTRIAADALKEARQKAQDARNRQEELAQEELGLADLERRRDEASRAAQEQRRLEAAIRVVKSSDDLARLDEQLKDFPEFMERLTGDEPERLDALARKQASLQEERRQALAQLADARNDAAATALPQAGLENHRLGAFRHEWQSLWDLTRRRDQVRDELEKARAALEAETRRIGDAGSGADPARIDAIDSAAIGAFRRLAQDLATASTDRRSLESELRRLGWDPGAEQSTAAQRAQAASDEDPAARMQRLTQAISLLSLWLSTPGTGRDPGLRRTALAGVAASGLLVFAGLGLVIAGFAGFGLFTLLAGLVSAAVVAATGFRRVPDARAVHQARFEQLGVGRPQAWTEQAVAERLEQLQSELSQAERAQDALRKRAALTADFQAVKRRLEALEQERHQLTQRYGLPAPATPEQLLLLVEQLIAWQRSATQAAEAQARLRAVETELNQRLAALAAQLEPLGYSGLTSVEGLEGALDHLENRVTTWQRARAKIDAAQREAERARGQAEQLADERRQILYRLGLDPDHPEEAEAKLREATASLPRYRRLKESRLVTQERLAEAEQELGRLVGSESTRSGLTSLPLSELEQRLEQALTAASQLEELNRQITRLTTRIDEAKKGRALEEALADQDRAVSELQDLFRREAGIALGDLLAEQLSERTRDSERPQVFHHARGLFAQVTNGRYRLELDDSGSDPAFRATETVSGEVRTLEELSDGTRVQLLIAVRLAFAELHEQGVRLPLVFDEVLATSDDERAQAVMDAALALAQAGRQVFYFTAQFDEVTRWRQKCGDQCSVINLAEIRRLQAAERRPLVVAGAQVAAPVAASVPAPEGYTYEEYGQLLRVPGIDPFAGNLDGAHLWYLLEEAEDLYRLLSRGLERWGQLRTLAEVGERFRWGPELSAIWEKARAAAEALEAVVGAWQIGRGRPVDRDALEASKAISATFIETVSELAASLGGDARRLLEALEQGQVPRFRRDAIERLREYLETNGYLDSREPLSPSQVYANALAVVEGHLRAGRLSEALVQRLCTAVGLPLERNGLRTSTRP